MSNDTAEFYSQAKDLVKETRDVFQENGVWITTRRLCHPKDEPITESNSGYVDELPKFGGKTFVDHIQERVNRGEMVSLLDIGCGSGLALIDLRKMFSVDQLLIVGIGHQQDTKEMQRDISRDVLLFSPEGSLAEADIKFVHTNFIDAHLELPLNSFDIISAVYSLEHIRYPRLSLVKKVWRFLKPGGTAFIGPFNLLLMNEDGSGVSAFRYLREHYGLKFEENNGGVSFTKTQEAIPNIFQSSLQDKRSVTLL